MSTKKEYLSEERYTKVNKTFKTLYLVLSIIGFIMVVAGIVLLVVAKENYFSTQKLIATILIIVGIALFILSIMDLLRHTFTRDIVAYYAQQQMPIVKEGAGEIAEEVSKGIKRGKNEK